MTAAKLRLAMAAVRQQETKVGVLCNELEITCQTLYGTLHQMEAYVTTGKNYCQASEKKLVVTLLCTFCTDVGITPDWAALQKQEISHDSSIVEF